MRIFGLPIIGILAASLAVFLLGFVWYGVLFADAWMAAEGLVEADYEGNSPWWMLVGFLISVSTAKGIAYVLMVAEWPPINKALTISGFLGLTLGGAFAAYDWVYLPGHNFTLFVINWSHIFIGFMLAAAVLTVLNKK